MRNDDVVELVLPDRHDMTSPPQGGMRLPPKPIKTTPPKEWPDRETTAKQKKNAETRALFESSVPIPTLTQRTQSARSAVASGQTDGRPVSHRAWNARLNGRTNLSKIIGEGAYASWYLEPASPVVFAQLHPVAFAPSDCIVCQLHACG
jgi:hypothetical protein